jgi:hypothetical protein
MYALEPRNLRSFREVVDPTFHAGSTYGCKRKSGMNEVLESVEGEPGAIEPNVGEEWAKEIIIVREFNGDVIAESR